MALDEQEHGSLEPSAGKDPGSMHAVSVQLRLSCLP